MKRLILIIALCRLVGLAVAEPRVLVLPFDPIIDSTYNLYGEQVPILNYQDALLTMLNSDLGRREEIRVVERSELNRLLASRDPKPILWNDPFLASELGTELGADFVIIGNYGEFPSEIRADARIAIPATADVPPGNTVSASAKLWDDLPTVASLLSSQIIDKVIATGHIRPVSKGYLNPEGDLADFDLAGTTPPDMARLVVWTDAPAPTIIAAGMEIEFKRCDRIDLMDASPEKLKGHSCKVAVLPAGPLEIRVVHRGFLPYRDTLSLAPGKAYRLEVQLKQIETQLYR